MTEPSHPLNLQAIAGNNQVYLLWLEPSDDGGIPINMYFVYRSLKSGGPYTYIDNTNTLNFIDTEVDNDKTFYYVVAAIINIGTSEYSNEAVATPSSVTTSFPSSTTTYSQTSAEIPAIISSWNVLILIISLLAILPLRRLQRK